nr:fibronectin type III domain-containing protein [Flavobacteriales bacterium]
MKIKLLSVSIGVFALFSSSLKAQITIDSTHLAQIGVSYYEVTDNNTVYLPGPSGTNQTWNFTNLNAHSFTWSNLVNPATTPGGASFPTSNVAIEDGGGSYVYARHTQSDFRLVGVSIFGYDINVIPNEKVLVFPATYNTSFTDTMSGSLTIAGAVIGAPFDSVRFKNTKHKHVLADAWGSISTPVDTYAAVRFYERALVRDSTWGKLFGFWTLIDNTSDSSHTYTWYTNDATIGVPLITLEYDKELGETTSIKWHSSSLPCLNPDIAAENINFPVVDDESITVTWANGNGTSRIVLASEAVVDDFPEVGNTYTANSVYGNSGTSLGNSFVVYNGTGSSVSITGLTPNTTYHFAVIEYDCSPERYYSEMPLIGDATTTFDVSIQN